MARIPYRAPRDKFQLGEQDAWKNRRRMAWLVIIWGIAILTFLAIFGKPDSLREALAYAISGILASTIGSYVFGAVWDDSNIRQSCVDTEAIYQGIPTTVVSDKTTVSGGPVNVQPAADPKPEPDAPEGGA